MRSKLALVLCVGLAALSAQVPARQRMVVMISLDGFPAYELDDPKLPIPTLRRLIQSGVTARMTTVNPTVTWPNHTTLVTGVRPDEHGLLVNGTLVRTGAWPPVKADPNIDKVRMVHVPTVYDAAHQAGLTTAQVDWVAINNAPTITWPFAEWASPAGPVEQEMIRKGVIQASDVTDFTNFNIVWRDQIWTKAAAYLIREHKPNLLLVHFLSLDSVHHKYGPKNLAATSSIAFLDSCVAQILTAIHDAGMDDNTTIFVVADHGFKTDSKQIRPGAAFAAAGLNGKVHVVPEGGSALVYFDKEHAAEILPVALKALENVEGLASVVRPEGYAELGLPSPAKDPQMADLFLTAKTDYAFSGAMGGPVTAESPQVGGGHGYISTDPDMDALFIATGYGVRGGGAKLGTIRNIDVAPTIAKLLGVPLRSAKGTPLSILQTPAK